MAELFRKPTSSDPEQEQEQRQEQKEHQEQEQEQQQDQYDVHIHAEQFYPENIVNTDSEQAPTETTNKVGDLANTQIAEEQEQSNENAKKRVGRVLNDLRSESVETADGFRSYGGEYIAWQRGEIICDRDHIQNQRIDVVYEEDYRKFSFYLKLEDQTFDQIKQYLDNNQQMPDGRPIETSELTYLGSEIDEEYMLCQARSFGRFCGGGHEAKIFVAEPESRGNGDINSTHNDSEEVRSALNLVKIEMPTDATDDQIAVSLNQILREDFKIPDALSEVDPDYGQQLKTEAYTKHYMVSPNQLTEADQQRIANLHRREVFPGYSTLVDRGSWSRYPEVDQYQLCLIHHLGHNDVSEVKLALTQGLMSATERHRRGVIRNAMNQEGTDFDTGGADGVFVRIASKQYGPSFDLDRNDGFTIVFKPSLFDRLDWYGSPEDLYGSTSPEAQAKRLSPGELLKVVGESVPQADDTDLKKFIFDNEQVFSTGISASDIDAILVSSEQARERLIEGLRDSGIDNHDGRDIEDVIQLPPTGAIISPNIDIDGAGGKIDTEEEIQDHLAAADQEIYNKIQQGRITPQEVRDIALSDTVEDQIGALDQLITAIARTEYKEKFAEEFTHYLKNDNSDLLRVLTIYASTPNPKQETIQNIQNSLGIDFAALSES